MQNYSIPMNFLAVTFNKEIYGVFAVPLTILFMLYIGYKIFRG